MDLVQAMLEGLGIGLFWSAVLLISVFGTWKVYTQYRENTRGYFSIGPFSCEFLDAFKAGECMFCGGEIDPRSLFGNSLIVEREFYSGDNFTTRVLTKCRSCRGAPESTEKNSSIWKLFTDHASRMEYLQMDMVIEQLRKHARPAIPGFPIDWNQHVYCLNKGWDNVQRGDYPILFDRDSGLYDESGYYCGECRADPLEESEKQDDCYWDEEKCYSCGIPTDLQWWAREQIKLAPSNGMGSPCPKKKS
jgi:hypothetical protein